MDGSPAGGADSDLTSLLLFHREEYLRMQYLGSRMYFSIWYIVLVSIAAVLAQQKTTTPAQCPNPPCLNFPRFGK
ncbi:hypothetical protein Y032_0361g3475 [Ancylostoma ceylanicum]|uniref:Uncharacterized protein n=1 Tax=Ancylostoma ceylanicum TaxID=53326 RepID=A0A016RVF3_9BILA|nr:hypothetical protein Y032_0361g3475 [Ancylostoma ceylanicum]